MSYLKFGFHEGPTGMGVPKDFYRQLDASGIPFIAKRTDSLPIDAQEVAAKSDVQHTVIYRRSLRANGSAPPSGDPNVPRYDAAPEIAGPEHWAWHKRHLPVELDSEVTWVEPMNEVDKGRAAWLADCCYYMAQDILKDGYKALFFGWSSGEPEPTDWESPQMLRLLRLLAKHPDRLGIALHEYAYVVDDIWRLDGWLVGRFQKLFDVCDKHSIPRPTVAITEWGWTLWQTPAPSQAMKDILSVGELYAKYPQIRGAAVWALNEGWKDIAGKYCSKLIQPLWDKTLTTRFPDPDPVDPPPPPPADETLGQFLWRSGMEQTTVSLNNEAALQKAMYTEGWRPTGSEKWVTYQGKQFAVQPANRDDRNAPRVYVAPVPDWNAVYYMTSPSTPGVSQPAMTYRPSQETKVIQSFGANPADYPMWGQAGHEGIDLAVPMGKPFYATRAGRVVHAGNGQWNNPSMASLYGYHVVIDHGDCCTVYAHAAKPLPVQVGQSVQAGQIVGYSGNTGRSSGYHLHYSILVKTPTGNHPGTKFGWFIDPSYVLRQPAPALPPQPGAIDVMAYMVGDGRMYDVRHPSGATETFQCQAEDGRFFYVKNSQWERLYYDGGRDYDTSPGPAPAYAERPGSYRYYHQYEAGRNKAQWVLPKMSIGQQFVGPGHLVQYYYKDTGSKSAANSGAATNIVTLAAHYDQYTFWDRPVYDVIKLQTPHEAMFFAKGYGLVGWESSGWGSSGYFQDITGRKPLKREQISTIPA